MNRSVSIAPISTTNITGLLHWISGRSMTNDCFKAIPHQLRFEQLAASYPPRRTRMLRRPNRAYGCAAAPISRPPKMLSPANPKLPELALMATQLSAERDRPQVLRQRSERGHRQEQQRADDDDRSEQKTSEGQGVVAQGPQSEWRASFSFREKPPSRSALRSAGTGRTESPGRRRCPMERLRAPDWDCYSGHRSHPVRRKAEPLLAEADEN